MENNQIIQATRVALVVRETSFQMESLSSSLTVSSKSLAKVSLSNSMTPFLYANISGAG